MQITDKAIAILAGTRDGALLSPLQLALTEHAAKDNLSARGFSALDELYQAVMNGEYAPGDTYLFDNEYLTRDSQGYVYWKGKQIEHYSHSDPEAMRQDANNLAERCRQLEAKNFPVTCRSVTEPIFIEAPAATCWLEAMNRFYSLFEGAGRHVAVLYCLASDDVVILERDKTTGDLKQAKMTSAYDAFHHVQKQGLKSGSPYNSYDSFARFLEASGLSPDDIHQAIA